MWKFYQIFFSLSSQVENILIEIKFGNNEKTIWKKFHSSFFFSYLEISTKSHRKKKIFFDYLSFKNQVKLFFFNLIHNFFFFFLLEVWIFLLQNPINFCLWKKWEKIYSRKFQNSLKWIELEIAFLQRKLVALSRKNFLLF